MPGGGTSTVLNQTYQLNPGREYTVVAIGDVDTAGKTLELKVIENSDTHVAHGYGRVQVFHGAPDAPQVDIYVTAPNTDVNGVSPNLTLNYTENSGQIDLPQGDYRIRVTGAGSKAVLFDTGSVPLASGDDWLLTAIENVYPGSAAPIALQLSTGKSSSIVLDKDTKSSVRAVHAISTAPAVDILQLVQNSSETLPLITKRPLQMLIRVMPNLMSQRPIKQTHCSAAISHSKKPKVTMLLQWVC
ncbi:hypothetical protein CS022_05125 [Veronia nyctiphanis]|uniref:DUF4397 domain-containing protein n=1 Tax=Veronia nyctiphanis TaxID=1278244 RepID=A0A4Q0YY97_9GAMM|nr:hypothetical protein CS022_05125 [Veronia nyctiphanis]